MSVIRLKNVNFSYDKINNVISDLSLEINKGEFVSVIGHNGSGKSTLAKLLNGLIKPDSGEIIVDGISSNGTKKELFEIRKRVGVVFQNPDNQLVASIVEDDVAFGPENLGVPRKEIAGRIDYALKAVGMEEFRKSSPERLSGGQKQRIAIAGVLALKPQVLVLDESTAMLDPKGRKEVLDVARKLNKENGTTVIAVTHYMEETLFSDKIVVLSGGKIVLEGSPKQVFENKEILLSCNLELPLSVVIKDRLNQEGLAIDNGVLTEEELLEAICK